MGSINVKPSTHQSAVAVEVDTVSGVNVPVYKAGFGSTGQLVYVDSDNPLPVLMDEATLPASSGNTTDMMLELAKGAIVGHNSVNKFGRAVVGIQTTATDIWDRADAAATQQIWLAPTAARTHQIASTSANDDLTGTGAQKIQVYGLTTWDSIETSEVVELDGTNDVATSNSYVIIHRMKVTQWGSGNSNVGVITATADTDGTVTAEINAAEGQTQMAIYGIPSTQSAYMTNYYASINKSVSAVRSDVSLLVNPQPDTSTLTYLVKHTQGMDTTGTSYLDHDYKPYLKIAGPAIIKMQATGSAADIDMSAGFDLIVVDNN